MFRLQNHVPEVYVDKSRDFQLFCRLYDSCFSGVKFSIDSMIRLTDTKHCDSSVLELLKTKLGLFSTIDVDASELRYLLQAFPTIMRYKGSKRSVEYIKVLYTKMYSNVSVPEVEYGADCTLKFIFSEPPKNDKLLLELLKYVLPTGYIISYDVAESKEYRTYLNTKDRLVYSSTEKDDVSTTSEIKSVDAEAIVSNFDTDLGAVVGLASVVDPEEENS